MGVVFKARDRHLGRIVALKRLTDNLQQHPTAVQYFEREARSAAALNHTNIVTVYDAGKENGSYFISMEFLEGSPLDVILEKRGALAAPTVARLGMHVAAGLHYAHHKKIIHRDIKTANLFFTQDKVVKIMDFGAFVNFMGPRDGLVHISELAPQRVRTVDDVVKEGDEVRVKVIGVDDRGKVKLSMKRVDQESGEDLEATAKAS